MKILEVFKKSKNYSGTEITKKKKEKKNGHYLQKHIPFDAKLKQLLHLCHIVDK